VRINFSLSLDYCHISFLSTTPIGFDEVLWCHEIQGMIADMKILKLLLLLIWFGLC